VMFKGYLGGVLHLARCAAEHGAQTGGRHCRG
jgi:hypothetical protein